MKLEAYHLISFILIASVLRSSKIKGDISDQYCKKDISKRTTYVLSLLPIIFLLVKSNKLEHVIVLLSYALAMKSLTISSNEQQPKDIQIIVTTCVILTALYQQLIPKKNIALGYLWIFSLSFARLCQKMTTTPEVIKDITIAHLLFYYSKF